MERKEETEERHARRDERKPEEGKRSGWKRDAEYKRGRIGGARSTDTTEPRRRFVGEARDGKEEKGEEEEEEAELVVHVLCPILYGERTALLRSPLVAQKRV